MSFPTITKPLVAVMATACLAFAQGASASPATVKLHIEGKGGTQFVGPVTTDTRTPDGSHTCNGPSPTTALYDVASSVPLNWVATWSTAWSDYMLKQIGPDAEGDFKDSDPSNDFWWSHWVNGSWSLVGGCQTVLKDGDEVVWAYVLQQDTLLDISLPATARAGEPVVASVALHVASGQQSSAAGAAVIGADNTAVTNSEGKATVSFTKAGTYLVNAEKAGSIRASEKICVYQEGSGGCNSVKQIKPDRKAPKLVRFRPKKKRYRRAPRLLRFRFLDDQSGLSSLKLKLLRTSGIGGVSCTGYDFELERFSKPCPRAKFKKLGPSVTSYQLSSPLAPGHYWAYLKARDGSGNSSSFTRSFRVRWLRR